MNFISFALFWLGFALMVILVVVELVFLGDPFNQVEKDYYKVVQVLFIAAAVSKYLGA